MQKPLLVLLVAGLVLFATGGLLLTGFLNDDETPPLRWSEHEEIEVDAPMDPAFAGETALNAERLEVETADGPGASGDEVRVAVLLRGRVVDRFGAPQAGANVWLDFGRGGPRGQRGRQQRRVPDPVTTDAEGRFAFEGQAFRSLRVSLQVLHPQFAPGLFDRDVGQVDGEVDLGDFAVERGGELVGRVTDLDGNGIAGALVELRPENGNRMRFLRDRAKLLATTTTDSNGYYRRPNVAAGEWSVAASARQHTEGSTDVFAVENERTVDVEDIRLGPGYEVTGYVRRLDGTAIENATVELRGEGGGRRRGAGHTTRTDAEGAFLLEHLPGVAMQLYVRADGFLPFSLPEVDPRLGQPLHLTLTDGLKITGVVVDDDGAPVERFAARPVWLRSLAGSEEIEDLLERMRSGEIDAAERQGIGERMRQLRDRGERVRGGRGSGRDLERPEHHAGGRFELTGLQEGVYEVQVQSPDHARLRSGEVELRVGGPHPQLRLQLDGGVYVAGIVRDERGAPVANAVVSLRTPQPAPRERGADGDRGGSPFGRDFWRQMETALDVDARTDVDGEFVLKHVPRGSYRLAASADGYSGASLEPLELDADRSGVELTLGMLGSITGRVLGLDDGEFATTRVAAVPTGSGADGPGAFRGRGNGGPFRNGEVLADGTYRIDGLEPGEYVVRSWIGSPQELMRELGPKLFDGSLLADVAVRGGEEQRLDLTVHRTEVGVVAGSLLRNGQPGAGLAIEVQRADEGGTNETPGGRGMRNFLRRYETTVAASGNFRIEDVPAGSYRLRVLQNRRQGLLHEEALDVLPRTTTERHLSLSTGSLVGTVTPPAGLAAADLTGNAMLLRDQTSLPENLARWRRDNATPNARVRAGAFTFDEVAPGSYLLLVTLAGREPATALIQIGAGESRVEIAAGPAAEAAPAEGNAPVRRTPRPR